MIFLVILNIEFDQVRVQIFIKELLTLNETIFIIEHKKVGVSCSNLRILKAQLWLPTREVIKRQELLIIKGFIS